jgi:hypothetical protein
MIQTPSPRSAQPLSSAFTTTSSSVSDSGDSRASSAAGPRSVHSTGRVTLPPSPASQTNTRPQPRRFEYKISSDRPASGWNGYVTSSQPECCLRELVVCDVRRDPQHAQLAAAAGLGDLALAHRLRTKHSRLQLRAQVVQEHSRADVKLDPGDRQAIRTGRVRPGIRRDPRERRVQRPRVVHKVEQIIKPAAAISRRPTVKIALHPQYPRLTPRSAGIHRRVFCHYSLLSFTNTAAVLRPVTGSPGLRLLRRLRPTRPVQPTADLSRPAPLAATRPGTGTRWFPCSLLIVRLRRHPALPLRHRCEYAVDLPHSLRADAPRACPTVPHPTNGAGTRRARPGSVRFEPVGH